MKTIRALATAGLLLAGSWTHALAQNSAVDRERFIEEDPEALIHKGYALYQDHQYLDAAKSLERYLQLTPSPANRTAVIHLIEDALDHAFPRRAVYRAVALKARGDRLGAVRELERYAALSPDDSAETLRVAEGVFLEEYPEALLYQGVLLYSAADYDGAIAAWGRYLKLQADPVREMIAAAELAKRGGRDVATEH